MSDQGPARVASVDGLRGLSAVVVMISHICNSAGDGRLNGLGRLCVMTFFIISGYVLTRGWRGHYAGFLVRRFIRLWPLYALCMAIGGRLSMNPPAWSNYLWQPFLGVAQQPPQDPVTWSLFVEAWAMPFMPLIVWIGARPRVLLPAVAALVAAQAWSRDLYFGAFFLIGSHLSGRRLALSWLDSAPAQWLGRISYSLYLSHVLTIGALKFHVGGLWIYLAVPASLAVAQCLFVTVERPSVALSRRVGDFVEQRLGATRVAAPRIA